MAKELDFEVAIKRLREISNILETGEESLENSMKLYEESIGLTSFCYDQLKNAKQKIVQLSLDNVQEDGDTTL